MPTYDGGPVGYSGVSGVSGLSGVSAFSGSGSTPVSVVGGHHFVGSEGGNLGANGWTWGTGSNSQEWNWGNAPTNAFGTLAAQLLQKDPKAVVARGKEEIPNGDAAFLNPDGLVSSKCKGDPLKALGVVLARRTASDPAGLPVGFAYLFYKMDAQSPIPDDAQAIIDREEAQEPAQPGDGSRWMDLM